MFVGCHQLLGFSECGGILVHHFIGNPLVGQSNKSTDLFCKFSCRFLLLAEFAEATAHSGGRISSTIALLQLFSE